MTGTVRDFYRNKKVLLTGGTGFLGKMIVEKLLRTCEVDTIYLIVRCKKGISADKRLKSLFEEPIFDNLREVDASCIRKIRTMEGDLSKKKLGLSEANIELIKHKINIVFHCGASLNMDSKLADAVITNVRGTSEILEIIKDSRNLNAFILVSTAYSNCCEKLIEEKFYESPLDPELLIKMTEELQSNILQNISSGLIGKWPNSYVFTKAIAESLLLKKGKNLPVGLFRPAIVTSTASEPVPGWSDNLYGPLGILLSSHCGILRVVRANGNIKSHTVPGDMCINALLCFAWDVGNKWRDANLRLSSPPVCNFSAKNSKLLIPTKEYVDCSHIDYPPFRRAMWYQMLLLIESKYAYLLTKFFLHSIPAYLIDSMLIISGRKPRMRRIYAKLEKTSDVLHYFLVNEWDVNNDSVSKLWDKLAKEDRAMFNFNINSIELESYFKNLITGLKKYILKEDMTKAKLHRQRYKRLMFLHFTVKYILVGMATYPIFKGISRLIHNRK